jgi:hypothetical protein
LTMRSSQSFEPFSPVSSWFSAPIGTKCQDEASFSAPLPCRHTTWQVLFFLWCWCQTQGLMPTKQALYHFWHEASTLL